MQSQCIILSFFVLIAIAQPSLQPSSSKSRSKVVGTILNIFGIDNGTPDPVTQLTPKQTKLVQSSYAKIMEKPVENGMAIMLKFFEKDPAHKLIYPFRDIPTGALKNDGSFRAHCSRIMYNLKEIIDNLDDSELVLAMLDNLASNHMKYSASAQGFQDIKVVILEILDSLFSSETVRAWKKLLNVAMDYVSNQLF